MFSQLLLSYIPSWFTWSLEVALKVMLFLALAGLATLAWRRASAAQRHLVWTVAVIGVLLLPLLSAVFPAWRVVRMPARRPRASVTHSPAAVSNTGISLPATLPLVEQPTPVVATPVDQPDTPAVTVAPKPMAAGPARSHPRMPILPWYWWAAIAWGGGTLLVLAWHGYGYAATGRLRKRAFPAPAAWAEIVCTGKACLLISEEIAMPVVVGLLKPAILLPAEAGAWPDYRRRIVLLHELAHIRRQDLLIRLITQLTCALYWFNPLVWLAAHRMRIEREIACDDAVLAADIKASDYAAHLLAISHARPVRRLAPVSGIAIARSSKIGKRIRGVLEIRRNRRMVTWKALAVVCLLVLPVLIALAIAQEHAEKTPMVYADSLVRVAFDQKDLDPRSRLLYDSPYPVLSPGGSSILFIPNQGWDINGQVAQGSEVYQYHRDTGRVENLNIAGRSQGRFRNWFAPNHAKRISWDGKVTADSKDPWAAISPDGRVEASFRMERDTTANPPSTTAKCYLSLLNRETGETERVEVPDARGAGLGDPRPLANLQFSRDGRYLAFAAQFQKSWWNDAQKNSGGSFNWWEVMVYDRISRQLSFANTDETGRLMSLPISSPHISADGRSILFQAYEWSDESNPGSADIRAQKERQRLSESKGHFFIYDTQTKAIRRFKQLTDAVATAHAWFYPITSEDCRYLVSETKGTAQAAARAADKNAHEISEILLYDTKTGETLHISEGGRVLAGQLGLPYYTHEDPSISADGRYISYVTRVSNVKFYSSSNVPDDPKWKGIVHLAQAIQVYDREMRKTSTVLLATDLPQPPITEKAAVTDEASEPFGGRFSAVPLLTMSLSASLLAEGGSVTAYEPVLIRVDEKNETAKTIEYSMWDEWTERVLVEDAQGRVVASSPRGPIPADYAVFIHKLKPGESRVSVLAVSALYPFATPGAYTVRVQRTKFDDAIIVVGEDLVAVRILPFDAARLKARCEELFTYSKDSSAHGELSMHDQTRALLSVRHDIALPYIDWHARGGWSNAFEAWIALRLIGSPRAIAELDTLAAREGKEGRVVREFKEMSLDRLVWSILGDHE